MATQTTSVFKSIQKKNALTLNFRLEPSHVSYANTLRRVIMTGVETVGFRSDIKETGETSDVLILKNNTPMTNEMLADRVGLLPISIENPTDWNADEYTFELNITNESDMIKDVVASDFEVRKINLRDPSAVPTPVPNKDFFAPHPLSGDTCLIAVLKGKQPNQIAQSIHLKARATIGTGREHARFIPISQCSYQYTLDENPDRQKEIFNNWLRKTKKIDPSDLEKDSARKEILLREFRTMEVDRCYLKNEKDEPYSFDFTIEAIGKWFPPEKIVRRALQVIQQKCLKYATMDTGDLPVNVSIVATDKQMYGSDVYFNEEDHTLGNLLQTWMAENMVDSEEITFVGYNVPHPLQDRMKMSIGIPTNKDKTEMEVRRLLAKASGACASMFQGWLEDWDRVTTGRPATVSTSAPTIQRRRILTKK
jgi:DNA-directed RNA polymerase subunit L/DNA-directed RNA polymerase alpha subunit